MPALIFGADQEELRLAFDDLEWAPLTSLFSVDLPLTLDLTRSPPKQNFENFLSVGKETTPSHKFPYPLTRTKKQSKKLKRGGVGVGVGKFRA